MLRLLGANVKGDFGIEGSNRINYSIWESARRMYLVNINWKEAGNKEKFYLRLWGKLYPVECGEGFIQEVVWGDDLALSSEERDIWITSLKRVKEKLYVCELRGRGEGKILIFIRGKEKAEIRDGKGTLLKPLWMREDTLSLPVKVEGRLLLQIRMH